MSEDQKTKSHEEALETKKEIAEALKHEVNQTTEGVGLHDIVVLSKFQKTGEDGKKLGYSWGNTEAIGVVINVSQYSMTLKTVDGQTMDYDSTNEDLEYYYQIGKASEVEFLEGIRKAIMNQEKKVDIEIERHDELERWEKDFKNSVSLLGKMARIFKEFNK